MALNKAYGNENVKKKNKLGSDKIKMGCKKILTYHQK